jgi:hypothetical protein
MRGSPVWAFECVATLTVGALLLLPGCGDTQGPAAQGPNMTSPVPKNNPSMEEAIRKGGGYTEKKGASGKQMPGAPIAK